MIALAQRHGISVRGYVSCAVDCPYEGAIAPSAVAAVAMSLVEIGCQEIAVADTIGSADPTCVQLMLLSVLDKVPANRLACHFHDTSGMALANVDVAPGYGIRIFDSAASGLGGCPYAPGAAGNVATGRLARHLSALNYEHGLGPAKLERAEVHARELVRQLRNN